MRPLPEITVENEAFWTGGSAGQLMITRCGDCAHAIHPPQIICPRCWSEKVEPRPVPGTGRVYSYTVNYQPWSQDMKVPFALAVVDVDGAPGVRVTAEVVNLEPERVHIGQPMKIGFLNVGDVWFPQWEPA